MQALSCEFMCETKASTDVLQAQDKSCADIVQSPRRAADTLCKNSQRCRRSESLVPDECTLEELESGEMRAICTSEGKEYIYKVRAVPCSPSQGSWLVVRYTYSGLQCF